MSIICPNPFVQKLPKISYSEHNDKIIKAIHNKITPLVISSKAKMVIDRQKLTKRPTFNQYSYFKDKSTYSLEKNDRHNHSFIVYKNQFPIMRQTQSIKRTLNKSFTIVDLRHKQSQQTETYKEIQKLTLEKLPQIRKTLSKKKQQLAKTLQNQSLVFQKDTLESSQDKIYNLEYVLNRLGAYDQRKRARVTQKQISPMRGYQNISPNKLKQYIECFKKKKITAQPLYTSKKRIPLPRSSTEMDESEMKEHLKKIQTIINLKSQKKINTKSKKELFSTKKSFNFQAISKKDVKKQVQSKK